MYEQFILEQNFSVNNLLTATPRFYKLLLNEAILIVPIILKNGTQNSQFIEFTRSIHQKNRSNWTEVPTQIKNTEHKKSDTARDLVGENQIGEKSSVKNM